MGMRSRARRDNRRRQKARARARREASMARARPRCPECDSILVQDEAMADLWNCAACGVSMLKLGSEWLTQIEPPILSIAEYLPQEVVRKAA